jgi:hypothetical protein
MGEWLVLKLLARTLRLVVVVVVTEVRAEMGSPQV